MLEFLRGILTGVFCVHAWENVDKLEIETTNGKTGKTHISAVIYVDRCSGCGKLRHYRVEAD